MAMHDTNTMCLFTNWKTYRRHHRFSPSRVCRNNGCGDASCCFWIRETVWPVWWLLDPYSLIAIELSCYEFQYQHWVEVLAVTPSAWDVQVWPCSSLAWVSADSDKLPGIDSLPFLHHHLWQMQIGAHADTMVYTHIIPAIFRVAYCSYLTGEHGVHTVVSGL